MEKLANESKNDLLNIAHVLFESGNLDRALDEYKKILAIDPNDMDILQTLGEIYFQKDFHQLAYESYSKVASTFLSDGQTDKAIQIFKKISELDAGKLPSETQAQINYAQGYTKINEALASEKLEPAIELIGKILKFRPEDPVVRAQSILLDNKINQIPVSIQAYQTLGDAFFKNNMLEKAKHMFTKITDIEPENPAVRLHLAQVYLKQGSLSEAKKEYLNLAEESYAKGNLNQAFDLAQKAIELKSVEAHYIAGLIYFKREKFEEAVLEFEALLRFKTNHLGALVHLGQSLDKLGRLEKARATFQKALETDNENPEVQEAWIDFCIRAKDIDKAIPNMTTILQKAVSSNNAELVAKYSKLMIRLEPDKESTHVKLIESLETLGDSNGAAEALYRYALLLERKKQFEQAVACLEKALVLSPANTPTLEKALARIGQKDLKGKYGSVAEVENPILLKNSDFWGEGDSLATFSEVFNEPLSSAASLTEDPLVLASACVQQGYLKAAMEIFQQILETNPSSEDIRKKLGEVSAMYIKKLTGPK